jgi:ArsR family transcriptional regulator, virulence genes transcriptional regulator
MRSTLETAGAIEIVSRRAAEAASMLKAMASETRLMILCALSAGELPVYKLAELTGQSQSAVSQHLSKLRAAGLVNSRRNGQTIYYSSSAGIARDVIETLCTHYTRDPTA